MKPILIILLLFFSIASIGFSQSIRKISKEELVGILDNPTDKLHVINFWATWCGPCVTELHDFQKVVNESDSTKVDFLFVSLDFPSEAEKKLGSFLKKNNYKLNVVLMTETDYNSWIDQVDLNWQGNIPATLFYNKARKKHQFISESMDKSKIDHTINSLF
jgi:thiol-disulfide isomerase/thioredoxin